jgi:uncharacterized protein YbbC (DUF1343 family)
MVGIWMMPNSTRTVLAIENLAENWPKDLLGARIGAVLHPASVMPDLTHVADVLAQHSGQIFELGAFFGPQHGIRGELQDNMLETAHDVDARTGLPVWSLYSETRKPTAEMLAGLDVLFVDLQDVGARYYTYMWTLFLCMEAASEAGLKVVVHDRPNPIGNAVEGEPLDLNFATFVGLHSIPARHGLTMGALARLFQQERFPNCDLRVLEMQNYRSEDYFESTGLPWVLPSPNMPTLDTAVVYPGMCLLEACNLSEGRGTTKPFEIFGAPWLNATGLKTALLNSNLEGFALREHHFLPTFHKYASAHVAGWNDEIFDKYRGQICRGLQIHVTDRKLFRPLAFALEILRYCVQNHSADFRWRPAEVGYEYEFKHMGIDSLLGSDRLRKEWIEA